MSKATEQCIREWDTGVWGNKRPGTQETRETDDWGNRRLGKQNRRPDQENWRLGKLDTRKLETGNWKLAKLETEEKGDRGKKETSDQ